MNIAKAQTLMRAGRPEEARLLLRGKTPGHDDPRQALVLAQIMNQCDHGAEAMAELRTAALKYPDHAPAHLFKGIVAEQQDLLQEAREALEQVIRIQPKNDLAYSYLALVYARLDMRKESRDIFYTHGFNDNRWFLVRLTEWMESEWLASGRFFKPVEYAPDTNKTPSKPGFFARHKHIRRANQFFSRRQYRPLLDHLAPELTSSPDEETVFICALCAEMIHSYGFALDCIARLQTSDLPDPLLAARGRCLIRLGRFAEAAADINRVLMIGPEDYGLNYYLGVLCLAYGEKNRARQLFYRAYTDYLIDTLEYQFRQIVNALMDELERPATPESNGRDNACAPRSVSGHDK